MRQTESIYIYIDVFQIVNDLILEFFQSNYVSLNLVLPFLYFLGFHIILRVWQILYLSYLLDILKNSSNKIEQIVQNRLV